MSAERPANGRPNGRPPTWDTERLALLQQLLPASGLVREDEVDWRRLASRLACSVEHVKQRVFQNRKALEESPAKKESPLAVLSDTAATQPKSPPLPPSQAPESRKRKATEEVKDEPLAKKALTFEQMKHQIEQAQCVRIVEVTKRAQEACMKEILAGKKIACFTVVVGGVCESVVREWLTTMENNLHFAWHDVTSVSEHNFYFHPTLREGGRVVEHVYP